MLHINSTAAAKITWIFCGGLLILGSVGCGVEQRSSSIDYALGQSNGHVENIAILESDPLLAGKFVAMQDATATAKRKIIYNSKISVETSDIDQFSEGLNSKLASLGGFIADFNEQRFAGDRRSRTWTLRVDVDKFDELISWFDGESNVTHKEVTSQDVTEEFVDLSARLENKRNTERRLVALLEERPGKLDEVLSVEREIDRVREDVERIEGRLRFLSERTALSTVTLTATTRIEYQAPLEASFGTRVSEAWNSSLHELQAAGESLAIGLVGMVPWLPLVLLLGGLGYWLTRWAWRKFYNLVNSWPPPNPGHTQRPATVRSADAQS